MDVYNDIMGFEPKPQSREAGRQEALKELNEWLAQEHTDIEREFSYHNQFVVRALLSFIETLQGKFPVK